MKSKLTFLILVIMLLVSALVLTSCLEGVKIPGADDTDKPIEDNKDDDKEKEEPKEEEPELPAPEYTIKFMYGQGDPSIKGNYSVVMTLKVNGKTGFTEEQLAKKDAIMYHGYEFAAYYSDHTLKNKYDFTKVPEQDGVIYCRRDITKAGKNITWSYDVTGDNEQVLKFEGTGPMYEFLYYDKDVPWNIYSSQINKIVIEEGITTVGNNAFYGFSAIKTVELPETVTHIGTNAFCTSSIEYINFPESLVSIGVTAFKQCPNLTRLNFNKGLKNIGDGAFYECVNVNTVVLTDTIMSFGGSAFYGCTGIRSAYYIGNKEDYDKITVGLDNFWVKELAVTYFLAETKPTTAGPYWYYNDDGEICQWYYTIWYMSGTKARVPFLCDYVDADSYAGGIEQRNIDFFNSIVYHGYKFDHFRFYDKNTGKTENKAYKMLMGTKLTEDIRLIGYRGDLCGDNLKWKLSGGVLTFSKIDESDPDGRMWDFEYVTDSPWYGRSINSVNITSGVTYIGKYALCSIYNPASRFSALSYIDIPVTLKEINVNAFSGCNDLIYIYYHGTALQLYGDSENNIEPAIKGLKDITVVGSNFIVYANAAGENLAQIKSGAWWLNITGNNMQKRVAWSYDGEGTLTVGGGDESHVMLNYLSHEQTPWYSYRDEVTSVIVRDNITTIGHYSFYNMTSVMEITVPQRILKASGTAFYGTGYYNTELSQRGVVYLKTPFIGEGAERRQLYHLYKVSPNYEGEIFRIEHDTLSISENAFEGCSGIKTLIINKDIRYNSIYSNALTGLTSLETIFFEGTTSRWYGVESEDPALVVPPFENTLTGEGELHEDVVIYFYSETPPTDGTPSWVWNAGKNEPIIHQTKEN